MRHLGKKGDCLCRSRLCGCLDFVALWIVLFWFLQFGFLYGGFVGVGKAFVAVSLVRQNLKNQYYILELVGHYQHFLTKKFDFANQGGYGGWQ